MWRSENSGIREDTAAVILESAKFARDSVRRTSRGLGLRSDSSARYEKGVDSSLQEIGVRRALHLVQELGCGVIAQGLIDVSDGQADAKTIETTLSRINGILGVEVPADEAVRILGSLRIKVERDGDKIVCTPPAGREDLENVNDLAEEVNNAIVQAYGGEHPGGNFSFSMEPDPFVTTNADGTTFSPKDTAIRAELATMLLRVQNTK